VHFASAGFFMENKMGQYHFLVNLDKKQVIHAHQIGNGFKLLEQIGWEYSTATGLVMLLAASSRNGGRGGGDFHSGHPLIGSWAGDRIAFVGDYAKPEDIPGCDATVVCRQSAAAIHSMDAAEVDLSDGSSEWSNISPQVREMMTAEFGIAYVGEG
jgi:hypothetical protein